MFRALCVVLLVSAIASAQERPKAKPIELPPTQFPEIAVKRFELQEPFGSKGQEPTKEQVAAYKKAKAEYDQQFAHPTLPKVLETDKPLVKLAKAKLKVLAEVQVMLQRRMDSGSSSSHEFAKYCELSTAFCAMADLIFAKPSDRLPWYEYRVRMTKYLELYYLRRAGVPDPIDGVVRSIDPPYVLPLASVERLDAEIALLKLKEQIGK